jgi:curli biogenesis system outer membrane secretion channel CsgG
MARPQAVFLPLFLAVALAGCAATSMQMGSQDAKTTATGSAAGAATSGANPQLEKCDRPFGTVALVEDKSAAWYTTLTREYRLTSTVPVLRLLIQQSNCFIVVERGQGMRAMQEERELQESGELRSGSSFGKGQMVSADYGIKPEVMFSAKDAGGMGGALRGQSGALGVAGSVLGSVKTREASTMLLLVDNRSGVQVAAAEGSSSKMDIGLSTSLFGAHGGGGLGGYTNTAEGKVIAAAFTDSYNQLVRSLRNYTPQTMGGQGLGTGGKLTVEGAQQPAAGAPAGATPAARTMRLVDAQSKLASLGYDPGPADGAMGKRTVNALRAFQRDRNLSISGRLDAATIAELLK